MQILSAMIGDGQSATKWRPELPDIYPATDPGEWWIEITGRTVDGIPDPNVIVIEAVYGDAKAAAIEADGRFFVLTSEAA